MQVLRECIARAGSVEDGLRYYVGAANLPDDGGYAVKVLSEQAHLRLVAAGSSVALNVPQSGVVLPARARRRDAGRSRDDALERPSAPPLTRASSWPWRAARSEPSRGLSCRYTAALRNWR